LKPIKCSVRIKNDKPILFWYEVYPSKDGEVCRLESFTFEDSFSSTTVEYMRSLRQADDELVNETLKQFR
jgi:hypothetical protein